MPNMIDVSSNNHKTDGDCDFSAAKAAGYDYVYVKIGEGFRAGNSMYLNPNAETDVNLANGAGQKVGGYWFYNTDFTVIDQAKEFYDELVRIGIDKFTLVDILDYEVGGPFTNIRDTFIDEMISYAEQCGQYLDRSYFNTLGYKKPTWLAIPGWVEGQDTLGADIIQTGQIEVPGFPNGPVDVSVVINPSAITKEVKMPVSDAPTVTDVTPVINTAPTTIEESPTTPVDIGTLAAVPDPTATEGVDVSDAPIEDSGGTKSLNGPIVGACTTPTGRGYWLAAADGGVFTFGDAKFFGSIPQSNIKLNRPVVDIISYDANGYALIAEDGGVFCFGSFQFQGSV